MHQEKDNNSLMKSCFITYQNSKLNYFTCGKGSPLLLMHGFAEDHTIWSNQIDFLSNHFFIIVPDIFGTGNSEFIKNENISISDYAKGIKEIIIKEKIEKFSMVGHSMGGYITLAYLDLFPSDLVSVGLINSTCYKDDEKKIEFRNKAISFIEKNGSLAFLKTSIPGLFFNAIQNEGFIQKLVEKAGKIDSQSLIQYYTAIKNRPDTSIVLKDSKKPILFISGKQDNVIPLKQNLSQCHLGNISEINILKNSGHMTMIEEADLVNKILHHFLTDISISII